MQPCRLSRTRSKITLSSLLPPPYISHSVSAKCAAACVRALLGEEQFEGDEQNEEGSSSMAVAPDPSDQAFALLGDVVEVGRDWAAVALAGRRALGCDQRYICTLSDEGGV